MIVIIRLSRCDNRLLINPVLETLNLISRLVLLCLQSLNLLGQLVIASLKELEILNASLSLVELLQLLF